MDGGILVPIAFFGMIAALVLVPRYFKSKEREALQATVRAAIERGQSLSPDAVDAITRDMQHVKPVPSAVRDLRAAVIWLAVAIGIGICGYMIAWDEGDAFVPVLGFATIPGLVGLAYLAMAAINAASDKSAAKRSS
jgi:uncharacterized protein DUF6249